MTGLWAMFFEGLETYLDLTNKMDDEPWILLDNSEITESALKKRTFFGGRRPIVFLNMCQSVAVLPSLSEGFPRLFIGRRASAVIGTECPMTPVFAHAFSQVFFDKVLAGEDIGSALLSARRHFMSDQFCNPLGLAYTLYGRCTSKLGTRAVIAQP